MAKEFPTEAEVEAEFEATGMHETMHNGYPDISARRENWNNWIDSKVSDGDLPIHFLALGLPDRYED